uniref:Neuregulin 2 n=1 Tax=Varanus komodoensis TaxID=61221 RepID=A0A8D2L9G8_VARKO
AGLGRGGTVPPKLKKLKSLTAEVGAKVSLKCEVSAGNPQPSYKWFKNGKELKKSKDIRIKYGIKRSPCPFSAVTTSLTSGPGHTRQCNETVRSYCVNGGVSSKAGSFLAGCPNEFTGDQCQNFAMASFSKHLGLELKEAEELYQKRVLTITGICVALLVVGIVCVVAYCKTKKQRNQMHNHLRQNMCAAHQNRSLANGPSHPRLDPEELQMVASQRVSDVHWSPVEELAGANSCFLLGSVHRHESHTWSLERTESLTSDCQSGILLSSVGTSKCNSPACVEARARREAAYSAEEQRRPTVQYRDSVDSLRDSPHSERYVSALTTPARLSPVDFHGPAAAHTPTFEITSPNAAHAASLPPAACSGFRVEEQPPTLPRRPLPEAQRYGGCYQRRSYLDESTGSLPSSPFRIAEDDDYETTHEYSGVLDPPRRTGGGSRRWRKSKLNGQLARRGKMLRDSFSMSSASHSESDEELVAESTPFLGLRDAEALHTDPPLLRRPAESRTCCSFSRRGAGGGGRLGCSSSSQDSAPP